MHVTMNKKLAVATLAHFAVDAIAQEYIQFDHTVTNLQLTTVSDEITSATEAVVATQSAASIEGGNGIIVFETEVCRPITTSVCETHQVTSTLVTTTEVPITSSTEVTPGLTTSGSTTTLSTYTGEQSTATSSEVHSSTASVTTPTPTPLQSSGAEKKDSDAAGLLAGLALFMFM